MRNFIRGILAAALLAALPMAANAGVFISVNFGPPALPVYVLPPMPAPGSLWTPGYWAWGGGGYYWVPGTWVIAPGPGLLWTPGYWGWAGGAYIWHGGYWGPHVGFYGGINYGFGYGGVGFHGGYWQGEHFYPNRAVSNEFPANRVSFNGGAGGVMARPTPGEMIAARDHHLGGTPLQMQHEQMASRDNGMRAAVNGGRPAIAATSRPGVFSGHGISASRAGAPPMQHAQGQYPHGAPAYSPGRAPGGSSGHPGGGNERQGPQGAGPHQGGGQGHGGEEHGRGG
jgi:WXXGXW repeat (2 copies)